MRPQATCLRAMQTDGDMTIDKVLAAAVAQLLQIDSAQLDAQLLLASVLGKSRSWLYAWPEHELTSAQQQAFTALLQQRTDGVPLAYLLGYKEFWNLQLQISSAVLIPRPETELLVELALAQLIDTQARVADLGTGSGAIALALASERPQWHIYATEFSDAACQIASQNCVQHGFNNITLLQGSWCEPLPASGFDMIVGNPPYLAEDDEHLQLGDVRFEPRSALIAGDYGLLDIKLIAQQAWEKLLPGAWLLLEHGFSQAPQVCALLETHGFLRVQSRVDLAGRKRCSGGQWAEVN